MLHLQNGDAIFSIFACNFWEFALAKNIRKVDLTHVLLIITAGLALLFYISTFSRITLTIQGASYILSNAFAVVFNDFKMLLIATQII